MIKVPSPGHARCLASSVSRLTRCLLVLAGSVHLPLSTKRATR